MLDVIVRLQLQVRDKVTGSCGGEPLWHGEWDCSVPQGESEHDCTHVSSRVGVWEIMITLGLVFENRERHQRSEKKVPPTIRLSSLSLRVSCDSCYLVSPLLPKWKMY